VELWLGDGGVFGLILARGILLLRISHILWATVTRVTSA